MYLALAIFCLALSLNFTLHFVLKMSFYLAAFKKGNLKDCDMGWGLSIIYPISMALTVLFFILYFKGHY